LREWNGELLIKDVPRKKRREKKKRGESRERDVAG
jgi:hypothetical protein